MECCMVVLHSSLGSDHSLRRGLLVRAAHEAPAHRLRLGLQGQTTLSIDTDGQVLSIIELYSDSHEYIYMYIYMHMHAYVHLCMSICTYMYCTMYIHRRTVGRTGGRMDGRTKGQTGGGRTAALALITAFGGGFVRVLLTPRQRFP